MPDSNSFVDCTLCNTEQVIPIVAGRLRMHFFCASCNQMVHVRTEEIRQAPPPPPPEPEPEPEPEPDPEPEPEPKPEVALPPVPASVVAVSASAGDPHSDSPSVGQGSRGGASVRSEEAWNEVASPSGQRSPRQLLSSRPSFWDQTLEHNSARSYTEKRPPTASPSGRTRVGSFPDSPDDADTYYPPPETSTPRSFPQTVLPAPPGLPAPPLPTYSSLNRNSAANQQLSSYDSRGREYYPSDPLREPPGYTSTRPPSITHSDSHSSRSGSNGPPPQPLPPSADPASPSGHHRGSYEANEGWGSQALEGISIPPIPRTDSTSRSASPARSPSRLTWRGSYSGSDPIERSSTLSNPSTTNNPAPPARRTFSSLPSASSRRTSASSFASQSSEEDAAMPSSPHLASAHLAEFSPTSPRSPMSPRPVSAHSPPGIASGYWPGQMPSSPRSPRRASQGWKDTRVPKRTTLQTLERERNKHFSSKDSFSTRPSSPLAHSSSVPAAFVPFSPPGIRSEWRSPLQSPLAPEDEFPPSLDLSGGQSEATTPDLVPSYIPGFVKMPNRTSVSLQRALPPAPSVYPPHLLQQPQSPSASLPASPSPPQLLQQPQSPSASLPASPYPPQLLQQPQSPSASLLASPYPPQLLQQPQSPSASLPASPVSPSIVDPAPLPLSPPDSPLAPIPPPARDHDSEDSAQKESQAEASPRPRSTTPSIFATYPRPSKTWSRDEPFSPRGVVRSPNRRGSVSFDLDAEVNPFQILRNGSERLDAPDIGMDQKKGEVGSCGEEQEFSFQLASLYQGPPLVGEIPVAKPLGFVKEGSGRNVSENGSEGGKLTTILTFADLLPPDVDENGDSSSRYGSGEGGEDEGPKAVTRAEGGVGSRLSVLGAFFPRSRVAPSAGEESAQVSGSGSVTTRDRRKGECSLCHRSSGVKEKCLVCKKKYCQRCVAKVDAMGSMPEGRKCTSCIGHPIDESLRDELGKTRMLRTMGFAQLEVAQIMKAELECKSNQIQPEQIIVNGEPLQAEEMAQLISCRNPPSNLKPGEYWYDPQSGFWGQIGGRPNQRITPNLRFRGLMMTNCSGGTTGVFLNNRELGRMELNILRVAGVEYTRGMRLWVDPDGSFSEEGQTRIHGNLWEKSSVRLLSTSLSYPKLNQSMLPLVDDDDDSGSISANLPPHLRGIVQRPAHKVLLLGCIGSGRSTIIKQVRLLYGKGFTLEEIEAYKVVIMRTLWRALSLLLEARENFCREDLEDSSLQEPASTSRQDSSLSSVPEDGTPVLTTLRDSPSIQLARSTNGNVPDPRYVTSLSTQDWLTSGRAELAKMREAGAEFGAGDESNGIRNGSDPWLRSYNEPPLSTSVAQRPLLRHGSSASSVRDMYSFDGNKDELADWVLDIDAEEDDMPVCDRSTAAKLDELWRDPAVQATYERRAEVADLSPFTAFFLDKILDMADPSYQPTVEDILYAEGLPLEHGVAEVKFSISPPECPPTTHSFILTREPDFQVHLFSVGYREKLLGMFDSAEIVLFCISLSEYDLEVCGVNQLERARGAFQQTLRQPSFRNKPVILLLNKFDSFAEKIESGVPLSKCRWLADYHPVQTDNSKRHQPQQAYSYIVYKFKEAYLSCVPDDPEMRNFFTCQLEALKEQGVETVFAYVKEVLQWSSSSDKGSGNGFKLHHISFMADEELALCDSNFEFPLTNDDEAYDSPGSSDLARLQPLQRSVHPFIAC